jgi:signal transduction histidine kinase
MRIPNLGFNTKTPYKVDFALVPAAIVLIEFSIFITQFSQEVNNSLGNLVLMRIIHTLGMVLIAILVWKGFQKFNKSELNFQTLAITGVLFSLVGDLTHGLLASIIGIELVSFYRRLGIILIQGSLWFPAFVIIGGYRKEIFQQFKEYENRLVIATRSRGRTSNEFRELQGEIQEGIRKEFFATCIDLKNELDKNLNAGGNITDQFSLIKPQLSGEKLRTFSRLLESSTSGNDAKTLLFRYRHSIILFFQQFRIVYTSAVQKAPLRKNSYSLMLIALVTPTMINFYSITEFLISYPVLLLLIFGFSSLIIKTQKSDSPNAIKNGSILIFVTGFLPMTIKFIWLASSYNPQSVFSIILTALALPLAFFISVELLQVLRPSALTLIRNDDLRANRSLENKVRNVIKEEFARNLSHEWAVFVHGKILTHLAATSLKLEVAVKAGDSEMFNETMQSVLTFLDSPDADFQTELCDLETEINSRLSPWRGLIEVSVHIDETIKAIRNSRVREVGQVIEELISNSIRHGKASKIDLRITSSEDREIEIESVDDATVAPPKINKNFGLGTVIFNLASDGRWSIIREGSSTRFRLVMEVEH